MQLEDDSRNRKFPWLSCPTLALRLSFVYFVQFCFCSTLLFFLFQVCLNLMCPTLLYRLSSVYSRPLLSSLGCQIILLLQQHSSLSPVLSPVPVFDPDSQCGLSLWLSHPVLVHLWFGPFYTWLNPDSFPDCEQINLFSRVVFCGSIFGLLEVLLSCFGSSLWFN